MVDPDYLAQSYDVFAGVEETLKADLDGSLDPRGPALLYDLVAAFDLPPGSAVLDAGCGEGGHALELARRFGFAVHGVDPVPRHVRLASDEAARQGFAAPAP